MKIGLLITPFNRPGYLRECLRTLTYAKIPETTEIVIIDDHSTDDDTKKLIREFSHERLSAVIYKHENKSIKDSLIKGCDYLFDLGCDHICNVDADAIVAKNFLSVLSSLKQRFPEHIVTGFNCLTRNRDGSERHKVLMEGEGFNLKKSVGGINMFFDKRQYTAWIRPALIRCLATQGNWDHQSCIASERDGKEIVCAVPSVVQHIGVSSSMGHSLSEPPDVADDFQIAYSKLLNHAVSGINISEDILERIGDNGKIKLKEVTLVGADCIDANRLLRAAEISCRNIEFGDVKIFSDKMIDSSVTYIAPIRSKADYSVFMMKHLWEYVKTDYALVIQYDGYVLNPLAWRDEWLDYDYIGARWHWYADGMDVGNGGFSLRSRRLCEVLGKDNAIIPMDDMTIPTRHKEEDHNICRLYRRYLERQHGIKFAPPEEADKFSIEAWSVKPPGNKYSGQFGFHGRSVDFYGTGFENVIQ